MSRSLPSMTTTRDPFVVPAPAGRPAGRTPKAVRPVGIVGLGTATPAGVLTNADLERLVDTSDAWIVERTGIRERRLAAADVATSDLAAEASRAALDQAGLDPADVELIVFATATPDTPVPATACHLQRKIGAKRAAGFDLSVGCAGFVHALLTAQSLVATGMFGNALVLGAEKLSSVTDYADRGSCILFGDAAGAVVLKPDVESGLLLDSVAGMNGEDHDAIQIPAGGSLRPASVETIAEHGHYLQMDGRRVFKFAVTKICEVVDELLSRNGFTLDDLDLLVPHQANLRILEAAASRLGLPMDRVAVDIAERGNTSSASIPLALQAARSQGRVSPGKLVCLVGFGAGLAWGGNLVRW